jgi:ATP-dependent helicase YprA (DUF1998 family)
MWVGGTVTSNSFTGQYSALEYSTTIHKECEKLNNNNNDNQSRFPDDINKFPITACPWCGCKLISKNSHGCFKQGYSADTTNFITKCLNEKCAFHSELPIYFVDEKIYQNPPTLLFGTVDKFAMLSRKEEGHKLFNSSPNDAGLPPDLIIQDELHLLSGPLGSITGLYESVVELLCTKNGRKPKIIASTATTRNTEQQVALLYGNRKLNIFPSIGMTYNDNFFSYVNTTKSTRKHIGFMPTGKTATNTQLRLIELLLLARIQLLQYCLETEKMTKEEASDLINNFWSIVSFYNSKRDLGKTWSKISVEITNAIVSLHKKYGLDYKKYNFNTKFADRGKELSAREESDRIKRSLDDLERKLILTENEDGYYVVNNVVDLIFATNMFSVGIDIERLNVMLMNGQPKNIAEYIQVSSRVGRKFDGIVINQLDANRSREKSYFENYVAFNNAYYKYVEPLSVTPFTEITLDKMLASILICYVRHKQGLNEDNQASNFDGLINELKKHLGGRIKNEIQQQYALNRLDQLSIRWIEKIDAKRGVLTYKDLIADASSDDEWSVMQSLREIDTNSVIKIYI